MIRNASRWWRDVFKSCGDRLLGNWYDESIKWKPRSGEKIRF